MKRFLTALLLTAGMATPVFAAKPETGISGTVTFDGTAPERKPLAAIATDPNCSKLHKGPVLDETVIVGKKGELANAVVYLKGDLKGEPPAEEAILDQQGCMYVPHVIDVTVGQKLFAQNSDPFLHNVHTLPEDNQPMNRGQAVKGQKDPIPTKTPEVFKVKCDVHPWMSAWIYIFPHPYHSTTLDDGTFLIDTKGLKDGDYEIAVWHEKFKECASGKVTVKNGSGKIDLKAKPKSAAAPSSEKVITVLNTDGKPFCCTDGSKCGRKVEAAVVQK